MRTPHWLMLCSLLAIVGCKKDQDRDEDGYPESEDCDDRDQDVHPGADEICNGEDDDCSGTVDDSPVDGDAYYTDDDQDGFGADRSEVLACAPVDGTITVGGDCTDTDPAVHPGAAEVCNEVDDDCDGEIDIGATDGVEFWADADADGFGDAADPVVACALPEGYSDNSGDCDDEHAEASPDGTEVCGDGLDNDCDGTGNHCDWSGDISSAEADASAAGSADSWTGAEVAWAGDLDGDGFSDALLAATNTPSATISFGSATPALAADATFSGAFGDYLGYSTAGASDVDGDGFDDVIIGAPGENEFAGAAYLLYGGSARPASGALADVAARFGGGAAEFVGSGVASAGDANGDGRADVLVGGFFADGNVADSGVAWLIYGSETKWTGSTDLAAVASLRVNGIYETSDIGDRNAMAGVDLDGDGASDLAFGIWQRETIPFKSDTWLFYGDAAAPLTGTVAVSDGDLQIASNAYNSGYMSALNAGDLNDDGVEDLLLAIDMQQPGDQSNAYVWYGSTTRRTGTVNGGDADVTILGDGTDYSLVPTAGDLNGDGAIDLVFGSNYADTSVSESGVVEIVYGPSFAGVIDAADADARIVGSEEGGWLGYAVAADGDANGDGVHDLLIGAPFEGGALEGKAYLFLGTTL
jgi:hypothetical protein